MKSDEKILVNIDLTLDQLIQNAEIIQDHSLLRNELEALQKTQESLLARLIHIDSLLNNSQNRKQLQKKHIMCNKIKNKMSVFSRLNQHLIQKMAERFTPKTKKTSSIKRSPARRRKSKLTISSNLTN